MLSCRAGRRIVRSSRLLPCAHDNPRSVLLSTRASQRSGTVTGSREQSESRTTAHTMADEVFQVLYRRHFGGDSDFKPRVDVRRRPRRAGTSQLEGLQRLSAAAISSENDGAGWMLGMQCSVVGYDGSQGGILDPVAIVFQRWLNDDAGECGRRQVLKLQKVARGCPVAVTLSDGRWEGKKV